MTTESLKEATERCKNASAKVTETWEQSVRENSRDKYLKAVDDWQEANRKWIEVVNALNAQEERF